MDAEVGCRGTIEPSVGRLFKGPPDVTVSLTASPAQYNYLDQPARTGIFLSSAGVRAENQVTPATFGNDKSGLRLRVEVNLSPVWLQVTVLQKQAPMVILAQILAILSGVVGIGRLANKAIGVLAARRQKAEAEAVTASHGKSSSALEMSQHVDGARV